MRLASKSRNELFCCRRRTIRVGLRQYFCYRLLKNSRNDFLLRYIDDAVCIQSEFWNDRKADEGEGHKDADVFRYTMCLEGIVQRLHFRRNALCAFGAHQSGHRERKFCHDPSILPQTQVRLCFSAQCCRPASYRYRCPLPQSGYGNHVRCSMQRLRISG